MLNTIIFILSSSYYEKIKPYTDTLRQTFLLHGVSLQITAAEKSSFLPDWQQSFDSCSQTLIVTDSPKTFDLLSAAGLYVIALYHENNQGCSFSHALYAVEDLLHLEYHSFLESYCRLAQIPLDILETDRLLVRESTLDDIPDFYRIYEDPSTIRYLDPLFPTLEEERAYLQDYIRHVYGFYGFGIWSVILKETGTLIGRAGLNIREGYEIPELGFVLESAYRNRGLTYEVCRAILAYAKEELCFDRLQALVKEENTASKNLLFKLGFSFSETVTEQGTEYQLYAIELK